MRAHAMILRTFTRGAIPTEIRELELSVAANPSHIMKSTPRKRPDTTAVVMAVICPAIPFRNADATVAMLVMYRTKYKTIVPPHQSVILSKYATAKITLYTNAAAATSRPVNFRMMETAVFFVCGMGPR